MDLLTRLERAIEGAVEGIFSHTFRGRVQPLDVARRLSRSMEDHKIVSVSQTYVPNEFEVALHPEDYKTIQPFEHAILPELSRHVEESAAGAKYGLLGKPHIAFKEDPAVERGAMVIAASFVRKEEQGKGAIHSPTTALQQKSLPRTVSGRNAALAVVEGPDTGDEFPVSGALTTIGRGGTNDVALTDSSVSRAHAEIELQPDGFHLKDLGSKNGSYVNSIRASDLLLCDGDTIAVGATVFHFRAARVL